VQPLPAVPLALPRERGPILTQEVGQSPHRASPETLISPGKSQITDNE
jgi:hypothetical protein